MKKLFSLVLAVALVFSCIGGVVAQAAEPVTPVVVVRGLDFGGLIADQGTVNARPALEVDAATLVPGIFSALFAGIFGGTEALVDRVMAIVADIFTPLMCDKNGNSIEDISVLEYPENMSHYPEILASWNNPGCEEGVILEACERYGAENVYYVTYDWRLDPYETAEKINKRVNLALEESGSEKVKIICCSMGGIMVQAYFDEYGYENVESCLFLSAAIYGTYSASDPISGKVGFDKEIINNYLYSTLPNLKVLWSILDKIGITDKLLAFATKITDEYKDKIYSELMVDCFGCFAGFWGMLQTEDFESAKSFLFGGKEKEYAGIIEKINKFQEYRLKRDSFLKQMQADGVKIILVCSYGKTPIPVYEHSYENSDGVLETSRMSAGATVAPYGKTLGDSYVAADPAKLSPDRVIDASTCLFPENTWFINGASHVCCQYGSDVADMLFSLLECKEQPTVSTYSAYPQFLKCNGEQNFI